MTLKLTAEKECTEAGYSEIGVFHDGGGLQDDGRLGTLTVEAEHAEELVNLLNAAGELRTVVHDLVSDLCFDEKLGYVMLQIPRHKWDALCAATAKAKGTT